MQYQLFKMSLNRESSEKYLQSRRSVFPKSFIQGEISDEKIYALLEVARWAPTHKLTQPWYFEVFKGQAKDQLVRVQQMAFTNQKGESEQTDIKNAKFALNAQLSGAVMAIIMKRDPEKRLPEKEEICAVACAVQNIALHAQSLALGGYWSTGAACNLPEVRSYLNLREEDLQLGWFYLGNCTEFRTDLPKRSEVTEFVRIRL